MPDEKVQYPSFEDQVIKMLLDTIRLQESGANDAKRPPPQPQPAPPADLYRMDTTDSSDWAPGRYNERHAEREYRPTYKRASVHAEERDNENRYTKTPEYGRFIMEDARQHPMYDFYGARRPLEEDVQYQWGRDLVNQTPEEVAEAQARQEAPYAPMVEFPPAERAYSYALGDAYDGVPPTQQAVENGWTYDWARERGANKRSKR